jgi:hypothetical protein
MHALAAVADGLRKEARIGVAKRGFKAIGEALD